MNKTEINIVEKTKDWNKLYWERKQVWEYSYEVQWHYLCFSFEEILILQNKFFIGKLKGERCEDWKILERENKTRLNNIQERRKRLKKSVDFIWKKNLPKNTN